MDTQLLPYRLKSARRKRRLLIEHRDKQLLKLDREGEHISNDPDYKTTVPLDEPYQKGWKRLFVLKPEVQQSDKAAFYQGILDVINTVQYHYDKSFKRPKRKGIWHKYIFKDLPKLNTLSSYYWDINRYNLSDEQRACFTRVDYWSQHYYRWEHYYEFAETDLFEMAIRPHIIDSVKVVDTLLEQRLAWIDNHIKNNNRHGRLQKLHKGGYNNKWKGSFERLKYENPLKNKPKWYWSNEW